MHASWRSLLIVPVLLGFAAPAHAADCAISIAYEDYAPYTIAGQNTQTGIDVELIGMLAQRAGCTMTWRNEPWTRTLHEIETGAVDATSDASRNAEREAYANFAGPYRNDYMVLVVPKGSAQRSVKDIVKSGKAIGVIRDYYYGPEVDALLKDTAHANDEFNFNANDSNNLSMLQAGRLGGVIMDKGVAFDKLSKNDPDHRLEIVAEPVYAEPVYIMMSKKSVSADKVQQMQKVIDAAKADGSIDKIMKRIDTRS